MIKVIASDMDGTFLDAKGRYDRQRFEAILTQLEERDIRFVVASGNTMTRLSVMFDVLLDRLSFVADNGTHVLTEGQTLVRETIAPSLAQEFLTYFADHLSDYCVMVTTPSGFHRLKDAQFRLDGFAITPEEWQSFEQELVLLTSFADLPDEPVLKLGLHLPQADSEAIIATFNRQFAGKLVAVTSGFGAVDVILPGRHKAWGLEQLLAHWQLSPEEVMAFGDGGNDKELLQLAGQSYAMANAPATVKAAAQHIAPHHDDNGVLEIIERLVLGANLTEPSLSKQKRRCDE